MNTITDYLETMFLNLPETPEVIQLKVDLLANMEDKYNELKEAGKSENEAIGTVIAEFGNIDELLEELAIEEEEDIVTETIPVVELPEALSYVEAKKRIGLGIGLGVFFCALAVALLIMLTSDFTFLSVAGFIPLFLFAVIGISLFIVNGFKNQAFLHLQKDFVMTGGTRKTIESEKKNFERTHIVSIVSGVSMCIFSIVPLFFFQYIWPGNEFYELVSVGILLVVASIGVIFFTYTGNTMLAFDTLLRNGKSRQPNKRELKDRKINHIFENVYWPLIVILFFVLGFTGIGWGFGSSWIVFPIGGILQEAIKALLGVTPDAK